MMSYDAEPGVAEAEAERDALAARLAVPGEEALDALTEALHGVTEEDAYAQPWTFGQVCIAGADTLTALRARVAGLEDFVAAIALIPVEEMPPLVCQDILASVVRDAAALTPAPEGS